MQNRKGAIESIGTVVLIVLAITIVTFLIAWINYWNEKQERENTCKNLEAIKGNVIYTYPPLKQYTENLSNQTGKFYYLRISQSYFGGCSIKSLENSECQEMYCHIPVLICDCGNYCGAGNSPNRIDLLGELSFAFDYKDYQNWIKDKKKIH